MLSQAPFNALVLAIGAANAPQIYIPTSGPTARPWCSQSATPTVSSEPTYSISSFAFSMNETIRTATSVPTPTTATYAPPYASLSHLLPNISTTTWGNFDPNATATPTDTNDPYGQASWSAIWKNANIANLTSRGIYSTTVSPTPVATSELVLPPRDYFGPMDCYDFPEDFVFGVAGSASQIEGAVTEEGKTPALMEIMGGGASANDFVTNENYYYYKQDIERLASIGVKYYSFSIAWTRILPFALPGTPVNQKALDHYNDVINFVLEKGMVPLVTILHFDTPLQFISNRSSIADPLLGYVNGGYGNSTFEDAFVNYGKIVMSHYADRVPYWATFNEPFLYADSGPAIDHVVKAHARLYHFYRDEIKGTGKVGMKLNDNFGVPKDPKNESDIFAANWFNSLQIGTFMNPILLGIDYPDSYKETVPDSIPLTESDLAYINGTADYLGIDPYTATVVSQPSGGTLACAKNTSHPDFPYCVEQSTLTTTGWNIGYRSYSYVYITPTYLRSYLNYLWNTFKAPVFITEFGFPVFDEAKKTALSDQLFDTPRSIYYLSFMSEVLKAIWEDHVHVVGALAWSFADNWEFGDYDARFGLQTVNRTTQERRYKKSFFDLVDFMQARTKKGSK